MFNWFNFDWFNEGIVAIGYLIIGIIAATIVPPLVSSAAVSAADARTSAGLSERRRATLKSLSSHLTRAIIWLICGIFILSLFVSSAGLLTFLGLFSAAFGLAARPIVSDYLSGIVFIFEDQYNVSEKVEIFGIEGTVIDVNLRTTVLRSPTGELYIIPNGEVRVVRNFGRGEFSIATIRVAVPSNQLEEAMALLETLAPALSREIPELIEPPKILSEDGTLGTRVGLTVFAKARFSQGVEARRKLLHIVQDTLEKAQIDITSA